MLVILGNETNATSSSYYTCEGCRKCLTIKIDWDSGFTYDDARKTVKEKGWIKRWFSEAVQGWFCDYKCAYESGTTKRWAKIWKTP